MHWFRSRVSVGACAAAGAVVVILAADVDLRARAAADAARIEQAVRRGASVVEAGQRGVRYVPGEVIVKFKPGMAPAGQQRALARLRSRPSVTDLELHDRFAVLRDATQPDAHALARELSAQPEVEYAEPNYIATFGPVSRHAARSRPAPRRYGWGLHRVPNDADFNGYQWNMMLLKMPSAWDIQDGANSSIIVAVIDSGVTTVASTASFPLWTGSSFEQVSMPIAMNPDLPGSRLFAPRDFAFGQTTGVVDMEGHGTHVASTIAEETNNGALLAGIAYRAQIMPLKACTGYWEEMIIRAQAGIAGFEEFDAGGCPTSAVVDAIYYAADNGARVINISLGSPDPSNAEREALLYAVSKGVFVAISMGNGGHEENQVNYPARYAEQIEGVMAVGAIGISENRAYYSSTGSHAEIAAPGGDDLAGAGRDDFGVIWQSTLDFDDQDPFLTRRPRFDRYDAIGYQGTSMAAPHVAGTAALIMAQSPGVSPANVERILRATAKDLGASGKDDEFGYGLIQPRAALFGRGIAK